MNIIKTFAIFKNGEQVNDKMPTHTLSCKIGEDFVSIGSAWTRDGTKGKFLSVQMAKAWISTKDDTKSQKSYVIVAEEDLLKLQEMAGIGKEDHTAVDPATGRDLNDSDNPF